MKHEVTLRIYKSARFADPMLGELWHGKRRDFEQKSEQLFGGTIETDWYNPDSDIAVGEQELLTDMGRFRLAGIAISNGKAESLYEEVK